MIFHGKGNDRRLFWRLFRENRSSDYGIISLRNIIAEKPVQNQWQEIYTPVSIEFVALRRCEDCIVIRASVRQNR